MNAINQEILVPALTFLSAVSIGSSVLISRQNKKKVLKSRLADSFGTAADSTDSRQASKLLRFLEKVGNVCSHGSPSTSLWEQLARAGYLNGSAPAVYTGIKILLAVVGLAATAIIVVPLQTYVTTKVTLTLLGAAALFFLPNSIVLMQLKKRHDEIRRHLPEAVDLLEVCVSSGIGLDMAWNIVADEIQHVSTTLADAMALTNFEIHLGASRAEAMRRMATRTDVDELASLAAILIQTERFGTSIATALRVFAESMREERTFTAQENAEKMAVKLILPMVLFIFPAVLIIVAGPAAIAIAKTLLFA
jgi:tight adherence protein C